MLDVSVNGTLHSLDVDPQTPLLWVLRDLLRLTGAKFGCGAGQCGVCIVQVDGRPTHACITPVGTLAGREVTTIEGLARQAGHPVLRAWLDEDVPQCGFCQPAQILAAAALLAETPHPSEHQIEEAMRPVLCRCGTYGRVRKAIRRAAATIDGGAGGLFT